MRRKAEMVGTPIRKKRRGGRTVWAGLATLGVLTLALTLFTLANRPRWHTITLTGKPGNVAVAFDCPEDWIIVDRYPEVSSPPSDIERVMLRRDPPNGWLRWWNTHVFHLSEHPFNSPEIEVNVLETKGLPPPLVARTKYHTSMANTPVVIAEYSRKIKRLAHPLGSAVYRTVEINLNTPGRVTPGGKTWLPRHVEAMEIYPSETQGQRIGLITVSCAAPATQYPQFKPVFDRVMQSVRLVSSREVP